MTTETEEPEGSYPFPKDGESTILHWPELPDVEPAEGSMLEVGEFKGDGIDCTCMARSSSECACDADWTPREVMELRAEIAKQAEYIVQLKAALHIQQRVYMMEKIMDKQFAIDLLKLLSALESWSFSVGKSLPEHTLNELSRIGLELEQEILK